MNMLLLICMRPSTLLGPGDVEISGLTFSCPLMDEDLRLHDHRMNEMSAQMSGQI